MQASCISGPAKAKKVFGMTLPTLGVRVRSGVTTDAANAAQAKCADRARSKNVGVDRPVVADSGVLQLLWQPAPHPAARGFVTPNGM